MTRITAFVAGLALAALPAAASAAAPPSYAPVDQAGPQLQVPAPALRTSLRCAQDLQRSEESPVLFIPPTLAEPYEAFFSYERALRDLGIPYCAVTIPHFTTIDIQESAEYIVHAIRRMHAATGRKVRLLGWSQGAGPEPRWALRFWPDVRPMVEELIGLEAPNHGFPVAAKTAMCPEKCVPALWQQAAGSAFIAALNSGQETFAGIDYTNIYSHTSQFVQPNLDDHGTTSLHGGGGEITNVATQDICPANTADHIAYWYDPVAYALVIDALTHPGPAVPSRVDAAEICTQTAMPYVNPVDIPAYTAHVYVTLFVDRAQNQPRTDREPPLRCYVTASCPTPTRARPDLTLRVVRRGSRICRGHSATITGADVPLIESADFSLRRRPLRHDEQAPFGTTVGRSGTLRARAQLTDGRVIELTRHIRGCRQSPGR